MGFEHKPLRQLILLAVVSAAISITSGCSSGNGVFEGPSAEAVAAELTGRPEGGPIGGDVLTQRNSGGSVTVNATWQNPTASGPLLFTLTMDTHSVDLDGYDLGKLAVLRNDQGQEVMAQSWDAPPGGHHRSGTLSFPSSGGAAKPVLSPTTRSLELVIRDVAGVKERVLTWEVSS